MMTSHKQQEAIDAAAKDLFMKLRPDDSYDFTDHPAKALIRGAFVLYAESWGDDFDIREWRWPHDQLAETEPFSEHRDLPAATLLRRAYELATGKDQ